MTGREDLIAAAAELGIPAEWHRLRGAPSNAEAQRVILYSKTAFWLQAEPPLGKRIFRDVADYYSGRADYKQIAGWYEILHAVEYSPRTQSLYVDFGRVRDVASLRTSLAAVGYVPVPDGPVDRALRVSPAP